MSTVPKGVLFFCLCLALAVDAQAFVNGDFESGTLTGWVTSLGGNGSGSVQVVSPGPAANTNGALNEVNAGNYSCRIISGSGDSSHLTYARISQGSAIVAGAANLNIAFAAVLDGTHSNSLDPPTTDAYFEVMVSTTTSVIYNATYRYASAPAALVDDGILNRNHLPWTNYNVDLSAFAGQIVTVSFSAYDCEYAGHDCTVYVDGFNFASPTPTRTITPTFSATPTRTASATITLTHSATPSFSASPTFSVTPTFSITQTFSETPTITLTSTQTPTFSVSPTWTYTVTQTVTPTFSVSLTSSFTPTITPTFTETPRPLLLKLLPPSPNPSNGADGTWIPYFLSTDADVTIDVWTLAGENTRHLHPGQRLAGYREDFWDQRNESGTKVASGIFIYRVRAVSAIGEEQHDFSKCAVTR